MPFKARRSGNYASPCTAQLMPSADALCFHPVCPVVCLDICPVPTWARRMLPGQTSKRTMVVGQYAFRAGESITVQKNGIVRMAGKSVIQITIK